VRVAPAGRKIRKHVDERVEMTARLHAAADEADRRAVLARKVLRRQAGQRGRAKHR
jgi:hypothetical protein